jgi:hypothetical protein
MSVKQLYFKKKLTDKDSKELDGSYVDLSFYSKIIETDCDGYWRDIHGKRHFLFSFRKKVIPKKLTRLTLDSFRKFSMTKKENRGAAAGPISPSKLPKYVAKVDSSRKMKNRAYFYKHDGVKSKQAISNLSPSNIAGFFDYPPSHPSLKTNSNRCKATNFVVKYPEKWTHVLPYIEYVDSLYKKIRPQLYSRQRKKANQVIDFTIPKTVFSTLTMNYSWRAAIHQDKHNIKKKDGVAILTLAEDHLNKNHYKGCYLGFPQFEFAVNVRQGDILITDNHSGWHGNTQFYPEKPRTPIQLQKPGFLVNDRNQWTPKEIKNNWYYNRMSMVYYLREGLSVCKTHKHQQTKKKETIKKKKEN